MRSLSALALILAVSFTLSVSAVRANCSSHPADVAPGLLGDEMPVPVHTVIGDGVVDVQDVLVPLSAAVGGLELVWEPPIEPGCVAVPGDAAPGSEDGAFSPARWTPTPNAVLDVGDVLVSLRLAVFLIELDPAWLEPILTEGEAADRVVAGRVLDSISSLGLPGVIVTAMFEDWEAGSTETDDLGNFLLQAMPAGTITLHLDGSGSTTSGKFSTLSLKVEVEVS